MKVLWFEVTSPSAYIGKKDPVAGWQDSLQKIVVSHNDIQLAIAFENEGRGELKIIDGVVYYPINTHYSFFERVREMAGWQVVIEKTIAKALQIVEDFKPDVIHVFGSEWCFGLLSELTNIPVVIHMQGSIPPYNNAMLPPKYSSWDLIIGSGFNIKKQILLWLERKKNASRQAMEERILKTVKYYMGRTSWDRNIIELYHPDSKYFYCSEALRSAFIETEKIWTPPINNKKRIVTVGVSSFWKGIDTILRTANMLKERGFDFEWICVGKMPDQQKRIVELKEKKKFEDNNVKILGFLNPSQLIDILLSADLYVHTAYIDNSPNAICEAQYLGLPILSTYVGGIPSLIENGKDGILVPANDPFSMAGLIMYLTNNETRCIEMGKASRERAIIRHNPDNIYRDLLHCYSCIIKDNLSNI